MSIATIITRGYGTFGTIPLVVTAGYGVGAVTTSTHDGADDRKKDDERKRRDDAFKAKHEQMREMIGAAYNKVHGILPPELAEVREVAAPFVEGAGEVIEIDWDALRESVTAEFKLRALYEFYARELAEQDDEETLMVLH